MSSAFSCDEEEEEEEKYEEEMYGKKPITIVRAIRKNDIEAIRQMISNGEYQKQTRRSIDVDSPFFLASIAGRIEIMKLLLNEKLATMYDPGQGGTVTPLWAAASHGQTESVSLLLDLDIDQINSGSEWGSTPLLAASEGNHLETARLLIERGADIDIGDDPCGTTPLYAATSKNHTDIVRLLLDSNCDLDEKETLPYLIQIQRRDGRSVEESKKMILEEVEDRKLRQAFDKFINRHIEYQIYKDMIYSICYPTGNLKISKPSVGWEQAYSVRNKYYFDEIFFYLQLYVGLNYSSSKNFSVLIETVNSKNEPSTLMTVLTRRLKLFLEPI